MKRLVKEDRDYGVHMRHCNQGENKRICKYGETNICPMLKNQKVLLYRENAITQLALNLIHELHYNIREDGFILASDVTVEMMEVEQYFDERDMR